MRSAPHWSAALHSVEPDEAPVEVPAPSTLTILAGDGQIAPLVMSHHGFAMATFAPVSVQVRDAGGIPIAGVGIAWSVGDTPGNMGVQLDPHGTSPCIVMTDDDGVATLDRMRGASATAFYEHGPFTLIARHGTANVAARLAVTAPAVLRPSIASGDNQRAARTGERVPGGEATFAPLRILLRDNDGKPAAGIEVLFEAVGPDGMTIRLSGGGSTAVLRSGATGVVTLGQSEGTAIVCSGCDGEFKVVVTPVGSAPIVSHHTVAP
jgi:hypothetical protein